MRKKQDNGIRTSKENIMVGTRSMDKKTGEPALEIKGKGGKFDTFTIKDMAKALYGESAEVSISFI